MSNMPIIFVSVCRPSRSRPLMTKVYTLSRRFSASITVGSTSSTPLSVGAVLSVTSSVPGVAMSGGLIHDLMPAYAPMAMTAITARVIARRFTHLREDLRSSRETYSSEEKRCRGSVP